MRTLMLSAAVLALVAPAALAQSTDAADAPLVEGPGGYLVFFAWDRATLTPDDQRVVAQAAEEFRRTGRARIDVTGHTDTSGSAEYNLELSQRRARMVADELARQGVAADEMVVVGRGEEDLRVPTADGVREAGNRRVEIVFDVPPAPAPAPEAEPEVAAEPPPPEPAPDRDRFTFALGPVYGHNFGESDGEGGGDKTQNDLVGAELVFRALPGFLGGLSLKQMALWSINGLDDGLNGRSVASLDFAPDFGIFRPTLAINGGGVYGPGFQDGFVVGPEIRLDIAPFGGFNIGLKAAYDYQFRNAGWDEGIAWGGLDLGIRF
jgi:hypothetical protein